MSARGSGRSSRQILSLPPSGVFVVEQGSEYGYRELAERLGRDDVTVIGHRKAPTWGRGPMISGYAIDHHVQQMYALGEIMPVLDAGVEAFQSQKVAGLRSGKMTPKTRRLSVAWREENAPPPGGWSGTAVDVITGGPAYRFWVLGPVEIRLGDRCP